MTTPDERLRGALDLCSALRAAGYRALLAGGCVRDHLLGVEPADIDIATDARPEEAAALFPRTVTVGARFGVVAVLRKEGTYEVATFRHDGPYLDGRHPSTVAFTDAREDALRRDFTINAMFLDPESGEILDYVGGQEDLHNGVIRAVGTPRLRFAEDRLRLLRAVRFAARFGYPIESETLDAIREAAPHILETSAERIRDELVKMLTEGQARRAFELLDTTGLLAQVLPEVSAMKGVEQPPVFHPEGDVFQHTLLCLEHLPPDTTPTLALAVLLHDVGKPGTQTFEDRIRFNWHEKEGGRITRRICLRLRMASREAERVGWLVENHMRLKDFSRMREHRRRRLAREPGFGELLALCRVDALASHKDTSLVDEAEAYVQALSEEELAPPLLLTGNDLIQLGYQPGPRFKKILHAIESGQLDGVLKDKGEALAYVREHFPPLSGSAPPGQPSAS
ncbi:MAG: CCA tRNA nucleotidyltransferase [Candidatus Hydrogenedentes bacterium]|nr:CCA tRNA nucleotidyltransferase [Candidatus Hydrogenedentota bacterium]